MASSYEYVSAAGSRVKVPCQFDKAQALQVTKSFFRAHCRQPSRCGRAELHLIYDLFWDLQREESKRRWISKDSGKTYEVEIKGPFMLAIIGDTRGVVKAVKENSQLLQEQDMPYSHSTLLYYACRAGFRDLADALILLGAPVNDVGAAGSFPLHAASFFGHGVVLSGLLCHGADRTRKNRYGNTAVMEALTKEIKDMLSDDVICTYLDPLVAAGAGENKRPVALPGADCVVAWKVSRPASLIHKDLISSPKIPDTWVPAWHGTKPQVLEPIMRTGLRPSGSSGVKPPEGHIPLGKTVFGITDFAAAVFVSPDLVYSAHPAYAARVSAGGEEWLTLVLARVRPGSFKTFESTVNGYIPTDPDVDPEWRVAIELPDHPAAGEELVDHPVMAGAHFFRMESEEHTNCVVSDVIFLSRSFLTSGQLPIPELAELLVTA